MALIPKSISRPASILHRYFAKESAHIVSPLTSEMQQSSIRKSKRIKPYCMTQLKYVKPDIRPFIIDQSDSKLAILSMIFNPNSLACIRVSISQSDQGGQNGQFGDQSEKIESDQGRSDRYCIDFWTLQNWKTGISIGDGNLKVGNIQESIKSLPDFGSIDGCVMELQRWKDVEMMLKKYPNMASLKRQVFEMSVAVYSMIVEKWKQELKEPQDHYPIFHIDRHLMTDLFPQQDKEERDTWLSIARRLPNGYPRQNQSNSESVSISSNQERTISVEYPKDLRDILQISNGKRGRGDRAKMKQDSIDPKMSSDLAILSQAILQGVAVVSLCNDLLKVKSEEKDEKKSKSRKKGDWM